METMKTVKVRCQVTQENPDGFYLVNEADVIEGMEVISEDAPAQVPSMTEAEIEAALGAASPGKGSKK